MSAAVVKFRLEAARSASSSWPLFVRAAARHPSYVHQKGDFEIVLLEFENLNDLAPYLQLCMGWRSTVVYRGEQLVMAEELWQLYQLAMGRDRYGRPIHKPDFEEGQLVRDELAGPAARLRIERR